MFLKNRSIFSLFLCLLASFCLAAGLVSLQAGRRRSESAVATTTYTQTQESSFSLEFTAHVQDSTAHLEIYALPEQKLSGFYLIPTILLPAGTFLSALFIFAIRQEKPYLGTEPELVFFTLGLWLIRQLYYAIALHSPAVILRSVFYLWLPFFFLLISFRGLYAWLRLGLPFAWSASHRLGKRLSIICKRSGVYLVSQLVLALLLPAMGVTAIVLSAVLPGAGCLVAGFLPFLCLIRLSRELDHLSAQINALYQEAPLPVQSGHFAVEERRLIDIGAQKEAAVQSAIVNERFKIDLITNVSHDLRTPLTSILGYGELLCAEKLSPEGEKQLWELNRKAGYMRDLVDSLFELSKVSSGAAECRKEPIDLIKLLEQTIGLLDDQLKGHDLTVRRHYESAHCPISTDGARMHQVFANLLGNAIKYSPPGTRIHLEQKSQDSHCTVRLTNIASYEMDFQPDEIQKRFVRGDKARSTQGSGLGLAIARTYTESVGGSFDIRIDGEQFSAIVTLPYA